MPITLTGLASGLDTDSIIQQLMADRADQGHRRPEARRSRSRQHKTDLADDQDQARRVQDRRGRPRDAAPWKATQTDGVLGPDQGRRRRARRRRHRRPLDPGRPPRLLGAARLHLHGRAPARAAQLHQPARTAPARRSTIARQRHRRRCRDGDQRERQRARLRRRDQGRTASTSSSSPRARPARTRTSRVDPRSSARARSRGRRPTRAPARDAQRVVSSVDGGAERNPESNVVDNAIPGVRLTLKGITTSPVSVTTTSAGRRPARDHQEGHRRSSTPTTPSSPRRARSSPRRRRPDGDDERRTCRRASCSATRA